MKRFPFLLLVFLLPILSGAPASIVSVDALIAEITERHPEFQFYSAEIAAVRSGARTAALLAPPELSLEAGRKRVRDSAGSSGGDGAVWSASVAQTFEWPGRIALRKAIANRDIALAELGLARFKSALAGRVRSLGYALHAAQERSAATAEVAERFRALRESFLARDPAGPTPLLETRVIESQEITLRRRATEAALAHQAAGVELNQFRGAALLLPIQVSTPVQSFRPVPALEELLTAAREHHFEFRARRLELDQQGYVVRLARHERYPQFTVAPFVSRENGGERETTVGVGLSLPLPLAARQRSGIDTAEARRRQAEAAVQLAQREMERDVVAATQTFAAKRSELARWAPDSIARFREAAELADRHFRLGAVPLATYVELQSAYLDAVDALLDTEREALEAALQLQLLTGHDLISGPDMPPAALPAHSSAVSMP